MDNKLLQKRESKSLGKDNQQISNNLLKISSEMNENPKSKKHIRFKRVTKQSTSKSKKKEQTKQNSEKQIKNIKNDWSIFSPDFMDIVNKNEKQEIDKNTPPPPANHIYKNTTDDAPPLPEKEEPSSPNSQNKKKLIEEIKELKKINKKLLNLMMEKESINKKLINSIDNYKAISLEKFSDYLDLIENLGNKVKIFSDDYNLNIKNNDPNANEVDNELNKNSQLKNILQEKNKEFDEINESIKKLIFPDDENVIETISENEENIVKNEYEEKENEIMKIKEDYGKLQKEYSALTERIKKNRRENESPKSKIKYIYKDISLGLKEKYESTIQELIEKNEEIKKDYNKQLQEINSNYGAMKVEYLNKQFENESKLMKMKKIIKSLIRQCDEMGIKLNIDRDI